jgi:Ca2+-binding RTX toxin-like protein
MAKFRGTSGADTINGTASADEIRGESGNDSLLGRGGNDEMDGGKGRDTLVGGLGNDTLDGDKGNDLLTGGAGSDVFRLSNQDGRDTITDFQDGLDLILINANGIASIDQITIGSNAAGDAVVSYLVNGQITEATLLGVSATSLSSSDFLFSPG